MSKVLLKLQAFPINKKKEIKKSKENSLFFEIKILLIMRGYVFELTLSFSGRKSNNLLTLRVRGVLLIFSLVSFIIIIKIIINIRFIVIKILCPRLTFTAVKFGDS